MPDIDLRFNEEEQFIFEQMLDAVLKVGGLQAMKNGAARLYGKMLKAQEEAALQAAQGAPGAAD